MLRKSRQHALIERFRKGALKRYEKKQLHDRMIPDLAIRFQKQGATVEEDPDSVDLLSRWPSGDEAIFEVKTVNRRTLQHRLRIAIGQVEEYSYRRLGATKRTPDKVIVINADLEDDAWQADFLSNHLEIGLICMPVASYKTFAPKKAATNGYWNRTL